MQAIIPHRILRTQSSPRCIDWGISYRRSRGSHQQARQRANALLLLRRELLRVGRTVQPVADFRCGSLRTRRAQSGRQGIVTAAVCDRRCPDTLCQPVYGGVLVFLKSTAGFKYCADLPDNGGAGCGHQAT